MIKVRYLYFFVRVFPVKDIGCRWNGKILPRKATEHKIKATKI